MRSTRLSAVALALGLGLASIGGAALAAKPAKPSEQLAFGVQMARRGLWNEAFFRFQQAARLDPGNPRIINNLAVASEARGDFEGAQRYYQEALRISSTDPELKRNYARFVEFYQSFKSKAAAGDANAPAASPDNTPEKSSEKSPEKSRNGDG